MGLESAQPKPITIVLADDDADDRMLARDALAEARLANDLVFVEDGEELMDYLRRRGKWADAAAAPRPGLILLGLNMPRKDGREALRGGQAGHARFDLEWVADYDRGLDRACSSEHDVCLVDYRLGPHDGVEFVREVGRRNCRVPVILLTGMGDHAVDVAAMNAGAADFLN